MAGLDHQWSPGRLAAAIPMLVWVAACASSAPKPLDAPAGTTASAPVPEVEEAPSAETVADSEEVTPEPPPESPPPPPTEVVATVEIPEPAPEPEPEPESEDETVVMIDTGARDLTERKETLAEAARAERERRQVAEPTGIVITDKNLSDYSTGQLTTATTTPEEKAAREAATDHQKEMEEKEAYWRGRAREIRQAWRDAYDQIPELETKVFELRQAFYREDDGFYRDAEIKPAWDRAIEQLEAAHLEVEERQEELTVFLEEGREAGALPGWLREGIELEPSEAPEPDSIAEPGEPVIYEVEPSDPP